jgi:predicted transcriptional regulator
MSDKNFSDEVLIEVLKSPEMLRVLRHMHFAKVDYAKNTTRYTDIPQMRVTEYLKRLHSMELLDIYGNTSIKRTEAKLKKSAEVHKHHTYYQINRNGDLLLKQATPKNYLKLIGSETIEILERPREVSEHPEMLVILREFGLIDQENKITKLGNEILKYVRLNNKSRHRRN